MEKKVEKFPVPGGYIEVSEKGTSKYTGTPYQKIPLKKKYR